MPNLELTDDEVMILRDLIAKDLMEIAVEIRHTSMREYREMLKRHEALMESLEKKLPPPAAT